MHTDTTTPLEATPAWFDLGRHDDDPTEPDPAAAPDTDPTTEPDDDTEPDPSTEPDSGDPATRPKPKRPTKSADDAGLGDKGKRALDRMKADLAAEKRARQDAEAKVRTFEDRDKSDLEKASSKAERLETIATKATARATAAEIRAIARDTFADPTDAAEVLMRDVSKYVDGDGEIDTDAIQRDLDDLLERKPHWAKPAPAPADEPPAPAKPKAKPDPGQGQRPSAPPIDYRTATVEERNAYLASMGYRFRS